MKAAEDAQEAETPPKGGAADAMNSKQHSNGGSCTRHTAELDQNSLPISGIAIGRDGPLLGRLVHSRFLLVTSSAWHTRTASRDEPRHIVHR